MVDLPFRITAFTLLALGKAIRGYFMKRHRLGMADMLMGDKLETAISLLLLSLLPEIALAIYLFFPAQIMWAALDWPALIRWSGLVVGLIGLVGLAWVHHALGDNFSASLRIRHDHTLVTSGPYQFVRHPTYTVALIMAVALLLITANWFIGVIWIGGLIVALMYRIPREEQQLLEQFGEDYQRYMKQTGRLWPKRGT